MSSSSDTLVAQPRFLHPRQLPPWVPSNQMHLAFQTGSRNVHAFQGPRPKLTSSWGLGVTRLGEDSSKRLISHPWSDTHSMRTFWPRTPAHPAAPAPGQWVPPVQPHPRSRAAPLASGQVSPGSGSPAPRRLLTLLRTPQRSTGGPDSVSGSSSEPDEFQLWLSDMEARQASRRPAPAPRAAPVQALSPWGEGSGDGTAKSTRSGACRNRKRDGARPMRRRRRA